MNVDYLIVGQGLAGTLLAFELLKLQKSFIVINDPEISSASSVAAGIINPVVFKRMNKSWMVDESFPKMESTYPELEELLGTTFYKRCRIFKILDQQSALEWKEKVITHHLEEYLETELAHPFNHSCLLIPYGTGIIHKAGRIDLQQLTSSFSRYLDLQQLIRNENFSFDNLVINQHAIT